MEDGDGLRSLNLRRVNSKGRVDTPKKLVRLAKPGDWCFSFDLHDGYHAVGIDPGIQKSMQFDVRGGLFPCGALPFGCNDSPRILFKIMTVLVECLRSPRSKVDRREVRKLPSGSTMWLQQLEALANEVVCWPIDDAWYSGMVGSTSEDGLTHVAYDDGDEEYLSMSTERYKEHGAVQGAPMEPQVVVSGWDAALQARLRSGLGESSHTELAVRTQGAALGSKTLGNYHPKAKAFIDFYGTVSMILHKEKGRRHVRLKRRLTIPAARVKGLVKLLQHWEQVRNALWAQSSAADAGEQGSDWRLPWELGKLYSAQANDWVQEALGKLGCAPPGGGDFFGHSTRKGACLCARTVGTAIDRCCFLGGWSQLSSAIHSYIDPTAVPDEHMEQYFGWTAPRWRQQQPGTQQCA
ncbi:hypothetical protein CYMTET_39788 [Cymbomonas tetramitiformis]|uniref:Uncharacterized protein n=1 Tax=Cymbomonas tetramitiformis TaxID=36881 RepID=A0AAE0F4B7_9CHLO|nr:hypothetical protein CYMTET_39788 [Cymbomonas tetramitiformis]